MDKKLDEQLRRIFVHAGIVTSTDIEWGDESTALIKLSWMPWAACGLEHMTQQLLDAGSIQNDEFLYFRCKHTKEVVTATLTVDFTSESWQIDLIKQLGLILIREVKASMKENE